jgi:colicin import membrane protein
MDFVRELIDAGMNFTQMTRERAEKLVNELVREGQVRTEEYQRSVQDLLDRSRENAERLNEAVRTQVVKVLTDLGILSGDGRAKKVGKKKAAAKKAPAKKKAAAKKAPAKKAPVKKAAAKKAPAKKKAAAKKAPAKRAAAKRAPAGNGPAPAAPAV